MPGQLPYLVKADRIQDLVAHVPESAKIYADRVEQNVPIIAEQLDAISPGPGSEPVEGTPSEEPRSPTNEVVRFAKIENRSEA